MTELAPWQMFCEAGRGPGRHFDDRDGLCARHTVGHVGLTNDTRRPALLWRCSDEACSDFFSKDRLGPGDTLTIPISDVGVPNPVLVLEVGTLARADVFRS